ncbi:MAG: hypothetical protein HZB25_12375 [Candidatus Eisenbacteria bacterium]|nr:hypothetical protein [Candidatus Eisenbacteria bacterium]
MRRVIPFLLLAAVALPVALLAADVFSQYEIDKDQAKEHLYYGLARGLKGVPDGASALKAIPAGRRAEVVRALGSFTRAYFESAEFKTRYSQYVASETPRKPVPPLDNAAGAEQADANAAKAMKAMKDNMANMPPEMQEQMKQAMAQVKSSKGAAKADYDKRKARYDKELAEYNAKMASAKIPPADPNVSLRKRLSEFLATTADINFDAELTKVGYKKHFADKTLEARPEEWKMWYRAGREATGAAREFAQEWLKDLPKAK